MNISKFLSLHFILLSNGMINGILQHIELNCSLIRAVLVGVCLHFKSLCSLYVPLHLFLDIY